MPLLPNEGQRSQRTKAQRARHDEGARPPSIYQNTKQQRRNCLSNARGRTQESQPVAVVLWTEYGERYGSARNGENPIAEAVQYREQKRWQPGRAEDTYNGRPHGMRQSGKSS